MEVAMVPFLVILGVIALVVCVLGLGSVGEYLGIFQDDERRDRDEDARDD